jgi:hypothetical protein
MAERGEAIAQVRVALRFAADDMLAWPAFLVSEVAPTKFLVARRVDELGRKARRCGHNSAGDWASASPCEQHDIRREVSKAAAALRVLAIATVRFEWRS